MKVIGLELYKWRHKRLFLMVLLFLLAEIGWAFAVTRISITRNPDQAGWEPLVATISAMNGFFLPILTAICVSRICDMEHKGNTWKLLYTLSVKRSTLYMAKSVSASIVMGVALSLQALAIVAFGIVHHFAPVPIWLLTRFILGTAVTTLVLIALQQWVSMAIKNQTFALTLGMVGSFVGLVADLLPSGVSKFFVWSYYTALSPITSVYADEKLHFVIRDSSLLWPQMAALLAVGMALYGVGSVHVARREG